MSSLSLKKIYLTSAVVLMTGCNQQETTSQLQMDSAHTIGLDATIEKGVIQTYGSDAAAVEEEIKEQLYYAIGQLNGQDSGADMAQVSISDIQVSTEGEEGSRRTATYKASMRFAWSLDVEVPESVDLIIPDGGDYSALSKFFETYDKKCIDHGAHDYDYSIFWYYYRPQNCDLMVAETKEFAVVVNAKLVPSVMNTQGKSPEYQKVWEDDRLVVTAIFGKAESGATSEWDAGISYYNETYRDLISTYGKPSESSVSIKQGQVPGLKNPAINLKWNLENDRVLDVSLFLVEGIREVGEEFITEYNERTKISDLVTYSGHSGLGANIRALANMGSFQKGQYQIYLVNGCDTFAYVDKALENAHQLANPDFAGTKFFDIITNAMPSYFHANPRSNMTLVDALVEGTKTYREILAGFDEAQRAVVTGEEDNQYPLPFLP